jgi:hypothetical protein
LAGLDSTGFRVEELRDMLRRCQAIRKVLILDCCHAGATRGGQDFPTGPDLEAAFSRAEGLITLASCRRSERSVEWPEKRLGLFTYFLTEGLSGAADRDQDGVVDSDEIYRHLEEHVPAAAQREFNAMQRPVRYFVEDTVGVFGLARYRVSPAVGRESSTDSTGRLVAVAGLLTAGLLGVGLAVKGLANRTKSRRRRDFQAFKTAVLAARQRLAVQRDGVAVAPLARLRDLDVAFDRLQRRLETANHDLPDAGDWPAQAEAIRSASAEVARTPPGTESWNRSIQGLLQRLADLDSLLFPQTPTRS